MRCVDSKLTPQVFIEPASGRAGLTPDRWLLSWRIQNLSEQPLQLLASQLPHSRFRGEEQELPSAPKLLPGESAQLELSVLCSEPPGTVVENAFLILRVLWVNQPWRILARLRVVFDQSGAPKTSTEVVTTHPVGFSRPNLNSRG